MAIADAFTEYGEDRRGVSSLQDELELHLDNIGHLKVRTHACTYARARAELVALFFDVWSHFLVAAETSTL